MNTQEFILRYRVGLYVLMALVALFGPIVWATTGNDWVGFTFPGNQHFELFGFVATTLCFVVAGIELWIMPNRMNWTAIASVALPLAVALTYATNVSELSSKTTDYRDYESAADQLLQGHNPYRPSSPYLNQHKPTYLYPPLVAQIHATVAVLIRNLLGAEGREQGLGTVFYCYQFTQFVLVLLMYNLLHLFATKCGIPKLWAHVLIAVLILYSNPVFRTFRWNQVNFWLVDLSLIGILFVSRFPLISGFLVALAAHIKLYPVILLGVMGASHYWKAAIAGGISLILIAGAQTNLFQDMTLWNQYVLAFSTMDWETELVYRNNSVLSVIYNFLKFGDMDVAAHKSEIRSVAIFFSLITSGWFLARFIIRERHGRLRAGNHQWLGHGADAMAFGLLVSPSVWEHHYVLAIPLAVWVVALRAFDRPWTIGIAIALMLIMPTFDAFPFSYTRIVGLIILLTLAPPTLLPSFQPPRDAKITDAKHSPTVDR